MGPWQRRTAERHLSRGSHGLRRRSTLGTRAQRAPNIVSQPPTPTPRSVFIYPVETARQGAALLTVELKTISVNPRPPTL